MKSKMEKSLSLVLVLCLVFTTVLANASAKAKAVSAKSLKRENASNVGIILGIPSWNSGRTAYTFPNVQATFTEGKQKVFCISVENGGYFTAPIDDMDADNLDITVVENDGRYNANVDGDTQYPLSNNRKLISMTVLGDMSEEQIEAYIKKITFYRGYIDTSTKQSISIISSEFDAEKEGATAMVIDGKLHFYKYIDWQFETSISYKDGTVATIPASSVSEDSTQFSWFKAYELAKKETMNGLKGYLATITSVSEQKYIYKKLGVPRKEVEVDGLVEKWGGAWIGGARSFSADEIDSATEVVFDSDTMSALYPSNDTGTMCTLWRWMCGPEAGNIFTTTNSNGKGKDTSGVNSYEKWAGTEPNNYNSNSYKGYNQEYCLQYGYRTENGEWNDWGPYHAPYGRRNGTATGSGEEKNTTSYDMAPMGFIVEFSPYDIDGDGEEDEGEYMTTPTRRDVTEISAQPTIESATIDNEYFSVGHPVNISSVIGNYTMGDDGKGNDELLGTDAVSYQWELSTDGGVTWTPIADATASSYTPVSGDVGAKLRCHITATEGNEKGYVGSLYVNANSSDDAEEKVDGSDIYNVEPIDLTFIKAEPVDLEEPIDTDGIFGQLIVGETLLEEGKDYTLDGDKVIISKDYLGILDEGVYDAEITYVDSYKQPFKIYVYDKDPNKVNVTPEDLTFDKAAPADVTEPVDDSKEVENLTVGDKTLVKDTDYTVNGDKLTINKDSLSNYEVGTYPSVITYTNGLTQEFNVNVIDSTSSANPGESASADPSASSSADSSASPSASADSGEEVVTPVDLVYEKTNPKNLVEPVYSTKTVDTFTLGGGQLVSGEYSVNGSNLIISSSYLNNLTNGDYDAVITYTDGTTQQFKVTVVAYNEATVVKNPPLFKMYKDVILKKKFKVDLKGITKYAIVKYKSSKPKIASVNKNGVITGKRRGKCVVTCNIIQNGAYYSVRVTVTVKKKHGNVTTNYNLNKKALVKTQGKLPEYNVYKRVIKKKKTKIIFQRVAANANVKFYVKNKKEKKILQVGKAKKNKKKKMVSCVIRGKKKGWVHLTARIKQHGMVYYTRLLVRVDDNTWTKKQLKKYLR